MKPDNKLASAIKNKKFIITAEYLPRAETNVKKVENTVQAFDSRITAINVADNQEGVALSSLAASVIINQAGKESIYQIVTRDRNRIALQSDLMGAACLGISNVLCLSGYHQTLIGYPEAGNVYDIDSVQLVAAARRMRDEGKLMDGNTIEGGFPMLIGAVINPNLKPIELNMIRLSKKVHAGADFIQTQAIFDSNSFEQWLKEAVKEGITKETTILAGIRPLTDAAEAEKLRETFNEIQIPDAIIDRLKKAGSPEASKQEGLKISAEIIREVKDMDGIGGIHILSGGKEDILPELMNIAGF